MAGVVRVGISGWRYPPWRGVFYPKGLPQRAELSYAASKLATIEINGSFYSLQRPDSYRAWHAQTPADFVFAVKGGRFVTHMKKLRGVESALANFFASGLLALGEKLGPLLWQLPPNLGFDAERLAAFFSQLPRSTGEAAWLARRHDERLAGRSLVTAVDDRPLRHALEVRHSQLRDAGVHRAAARAPDRGRRRRHRGQVAADPRGDGRLRLPAPARRRRAVRQRLLRRGAGRVGGDDSTAGPPQGTTCSSTSTTTSRCGRRSTPSPWPNGSVSPLSPRSGRPAAVSPIRSMTEESVRVVTSPSSRWSATSRSSRRMILPERVFGSSAHDQHLARLGDRPDLVSDVVAQRLDQLLAPRPRRSGRRRAG